MLRFSDWLSRIKGATMYAHSALRASTLVTLGFTCELEIRMKMKLMIAYCDRHPSKFNSIAFLFDGCRLRGEDSDELQMGDGDEIDAMLNQTGAFTTNFVG
ncbi:hypothetical protein IFM89_016209 [Coptis chinensis]|uniref:Rad60/SUMO-like domain-containing protein n=1 Tax=Coptis chinensis TaxID=261450 RepID=A0A835LI60_9MAGN|nr:hypothetical protein IFM89_016209 [Coptis chinensis]